MTTGADWTTEALEAVGFGGFLALEDAVKFAPVGPGVYLVIREPSDQPAFLSISAGGHFKGRDPSAAVAGLEAKWVPGAPVVYIGQGGNLRRRLTQLYRFGSGMPVGHWGGRYLWQLRDADALRIAWKVEPDPRGAEVALIAGFVAAHGSLPFANLR